MFHFKKKEYLTKEDLQVFQETLLEKLAEQKRLQERTESYTGNRFQELMEVSGKAEKRQKKIENGVEELLEQSDEMREMLNGMEQVSKETFAAANRKNTHLIEVIMKYEEALQQYRELTRGQYEEHRLLMDRMLERICGEAGLKKIPTQGQMADTEMVEIMDTEAVDDPLQNGIISREITAGWMYEGKVFRKARVVIYKIRERKQEEHETC